MAAEDGFLPGDELFLHRHKTISMSFVEKSGLHGVFGEVVEFPGGLFFTVNRVDFERPVEESGVAGLMGLGSVSGEFVDVFENATGKGSGLSRLLGLHQGLDRLVTVG